MWSTPGGWGSGDLAEFALAAPRAEERKLGGSSSVR
jgi:hypothetical protein